MNVFNTENNKSTLSKNFFFLGTLTVIIINVLGFYFFSNSEEFITQYNWKSVLSFKNLLIHFISAFKHFNLQHLLLNSLCFLIAGAYVERRQGTIGLLFLVFIFTFYGECVTAAKDAGTGGWGFSGVNYSFYSYIIIDFIFSFKQIKANKIELIISITVLCLIYLACCFSGRTSKFSFKIYPYDLISNLGHYSAFLSSIVLSLTIKLSRLKGLNK